MARRTKQEMEQMKSDARFYLLRTNNKPQPAFELMVKECLEAGESIPYYIKDSKDFIKVSQELALELNRVDQMGKRDREQAMAKESIVNYIMNLSVNEIKSIYKKYKDNVTQSNKLILNEIYMMIYSNDMKEEYINQATINLFSNILNQESQSVEEIATGIEQEEINTEIKSVINSLTSSYPNFNQEDIATLDNLTQYTEGELFDTLTKFLYSAIYLDGKNSITFLNQALTLVNEDETESDQSSEIMQSFSYTVTDNYIPQPLSGTINANSKEEACDLLVDIYKDELGVSESDLEITLHEIQ